MKRKIIAAMTGAACLASFALCSHGQGYVHFDNYNCIPYYPVVYGPGTGGLQGTGAGANVSVELGYALGANQTTGFTFVPGSITAIMPDVYCPPYGETGLGTTGWFQGPLVTIPNYVSGPVTFEILAWTQDYHFDNLSNPLIWTEPSIVVPPDPGGFFTALPGSIYLIVDVPEPAVLALAGLGALISLAAFRLNQS